MKHSIHRVGIYGSSSGRNAGDAALIGGIMDAMDGEFGRSIVYEIPTYRPDYIWLQYPNKTRPVSMLPWHGAVGMFSAQGLSSFRRCDLNIVYDNMLFDKKLWNQLFNYMPAVWAYFAKCKRQGQLLGMYNVGTGPVTTPRGREMLRVIAEACDLITVRDKDSLDLLRDVGVTHDRILTTADAAVTVVPSPVEKAHEMLREIGIAPGTEVIGFNVNSYLNTWSDKAGGALSAETFAEIYAEAVTRIAREIQVPVVFLCTQHSDIEITTAVMGRVAPDVTSSILTNVKYNHADMKAVLGQLSFLFAMRLHANILATSMCTPAHAISFQRKVTSYYTDLGLEDCIMNFDSFSVNSICDHVLRGWARRDEIRRHLQYRMPFTQRKALVAASAFRKLAETGLPSAAVAHGQELLRNIQTELAAGLEQREQVTASR